MEIKWPGREAEHSPYAKNVLSYSSTPRYASLARCIIKRGNFTCTLLKTGSYIGVLVYLISWELSLRR